MTSRDVDAHRILPPPRLPTQCLLVQRIDEEVQSLRGRGVPCSKRFGLGRFKSDLKVRLFEKPAKGNEHSMLLFVTKTLGASSQFHCFAEVCTSRDDGEASD